MASRIRAMATAVVDDRRHGRFGIAGEVHEGIVISIREIRDTQFLPVSEFKWQIDAKEILEKIEEVFRVVMVSDWHGSFSLTWEEGAFVPVARLAFEKREKIRSNGMIA